MLRCLRLSGLASDNPPPIAPQTITPSLVSEFGFALDMSNGIVLYAKNGSIVYEYPASTVKVMTALLIAELKGDDLAGTVTWQTSDDLDSGFSQVGFQNGDVVTWTDLLHGILMVSGGDACQAAARVIGNEALGAALTSTAGYAKFVEMMNARARGLGCLSTVFANSHGADAHVVTARDMAVIAGTCFRNAVIDALARDLSYTINVTGANARAIGLTNANSALSIAGVAGSKTGSLSGGGYPTTWNLVTLWTSPGGVDVAIVNMGAETSSAGYADTSNMIDTLEDDFPYLI